MGNADKSVMGRIHEKIENADHKGEKAGCDALRHEDP
jgi:hypothetical protein